MVFLRRHTYSRLHFCHIRCFWSSQRILALRRQSSCASSLLLYRSFYAWSTHLNLRNTLQPVRLILFALSVRSHPAGQASNGGAGSREGRIVSLQGVADCGILILAAFKSACWSAGPLLLAARKPVCGVCREERKHGASPHKLSCEFHQTSR